MYAFTALAASLTVNAPTGTPVDGNRLAIRLALDTLARNVTWNSAYNALGTALPTTVAGNKTAFVEFVYNAGTSKWDAVIVTSS